MAKKSPSPTKQAIIDELIKEIAKGKDRAKVLATAVKKWQISVRTFDRHWKTANEQHAKRQQKAKEAADKVYIEAAEQSALEAVMSQQERKEVLTKIARGQIPLLKPMVVDGAIQMIGIVPDWMDRKNAIAELNKMDGGYSPLEIDNKTTVVIGYGKEEEN